MQSSPTPTVACCLRSRPRPNRISSTRAGLARAIAFSSAVAGTMLVANGGFSAAAAAAPVTVLGLPTYQAASFGASGSAATFTCSGTAGQSTLTCTAGTTDFVPGEGIRITSGGVASKAPAITAAPSISPSYPNGQKSGSHSHCYFVISADPLGGLSAPSPVSCVHNQPSVAYSVLQNYLTTQGNDYRDQGPSITFLWYVSEDGGPYQLVSIAPYQDETTDEGQRIGSANGWPNNFAVTAPSISKPEDLFATVVAVAGPQITLSVPLAATVNAQVVAHDDTNSIQQAINAAVANGGGVVQMGTGTFNVGRPSFQYYPGGDSSYPPFSTSIGLDTWYLPYAYLYIPNGAKGNVFIQGNGSGTVLNTPPEHGDAEFLSVGAYLRPAYVANGMVSMMPVDKGATTVTLTGASAGQFQPGDDIWLFSGSFNGSPCLDTTGGGTAGGQCHFSELNTVTAVNGPTLTLAYPASKRYYDDGSSSFGLVKLPVTPHSVALQAMTIDTYDKITGVGMLYGFLVNGVTINGFSTPGPFGGGWKRDVLIENSKWSFGACSSFYQVLDEYDQFTNLALVNDNITGCSQLGSEGPSQQAQIHASEGSSQVTVMNSQFTNASLYIDQTTDDLIQGNSFHNGIVTVGSTYQPVYNSLRTAPVADQSFVSFDSQNQLQVLNNSFLQDSDYNPNWNIKIGHFNNATIDSNTMTVNSKISMFSVVSYGGAVTNNTLYLPLFSFARSFVLEPDEAPGIAPASFFVKANNVVGGLNSFIFLAVPGFSDSAPVCIEQNRMQGVMTNLFVPQSIFLPGTTLNCDAAALAADGISSSLMTKY